MENWILRPPFCAASTQQGSTRKPKLFCIPQAGMGAWAYNAIARHLQDQAEVLPIELPGRNSRAKERPETDLKHLAKQIADVIQAIVGSSPEIPYLIFGHSMGAWLAFEAVQDLMRKGFPPPLQLYVAANRAPSLCCQDPDPTRLSKLSSPDEFFRALERRYGPNPSLTNPAIRAHCWHTLKADFEMLESYQYDCNGCKPVDCPMTAIGGESDNRYSKKQLEAWQEQAGSSFRAVWLHGVGHSFITTPPEQLLNLLKCDISGWEMPKHDAVGK